MTNHPNRSKKTFKSIPAYPAMIGDTRLRLVKDWTYDGGTLKAGTVVQPQSAGHDNLRKRDERIVLAAGQRCIGPA